MHDDEIQRAKTRHPSGLVPEKKMRVFEVCFERTIKQIVQVEAEYIEDAVQLVEDSFGQDERYCKHIDESTIDFEIAWKQQVWP